MESLATEEKAAEVVGDGEGEAIHAIASFELALEIGAPDVVGSQDRTGGFAGVTDSSTPSENGDHAIAFQDILNRCAAWEIPKRVLAMGYLEDLLPAPGRKLAAQFKQLGDDLRIGFVGGVVWFSGKVLESAWSVIHIAFDPFIACLARYLIALAKFREREPLF
jgi:hypothetical protein